MVAPTFLNRLGLDLAADERAIKRAYARELKQIDLETDAAGFQVLRDAYEMALHWVRHHAAADFAPAALEPVLPAVPESARASPTVQVAAAPARDADTGDSPLQLAQAVFDDFCDAAAQMSAPGSARDSLQWRRHLQRCVSDNRLLSISAGAYFEFFVARLLAEGWRSGHEELFIAARQVFGWDKDRRRLVSFGPAGEWLDQAIDECGMFTQQYSADCSGQGDAIARVRDEAAPKTSELLRHVPHLRNMAARFPAWTQVSASRERI
jgi:protein TonB